MCLPAILDPSYKVYAAHIAFNGLIHHRQMPLLTNPNFALQVSPFCSKIFTQILCSVDKISKKSAMHTVFEWNSCFHSTTECGSIEWKTAVEPDLIVKGMITRPSCDFRREVARAVRELSEQAWKQETRPSKCVKNLCTARTWHWTDSDLWNVKHVFFLSKYTFQYFWRRGESLKMRYWKLGF